MKNETIVALSTPPGMGAIAVVRLSGPGAIAICSKLFSQSLEEKASHTLHFGYLSENKKVIDEVIVALFCAPNSYTGEDVVEVSCHGSIYIQQEVLQLFLRNGCRLASPGEFTLRSFLNGKRDLSQAEAVADLIACESAASHKIAFQQLRGGFSSEIQSLRAQLLHFAALITLELDFSEEDVEFADRSQLQSLVVEIESVLKRLIDSFAVGNALKKGIPVAIVGAPNVGKSTLLNALLGEEKAIVSSIPGTTRDAIEDTMVIGGIQFRFIDTAGIRETQDVVEHIGIQKTFEKIAGAEVVLYVFDAATAVTELVHSELAAINEKFPGEKVLVIANKTDLAPATQFEDVVSIVASEGMGLEDVKQRLLSLVAGDALRSGETIVSNTRHYDALLKALQEMEAVAEGVAVGISGDLLAIDIREALYYLGLITGEVTTDDVLGEVFGRFCVGK